MNLFYNLLATLSVVDIQFSIDILNHKYVYNVVMFHCYNNIITNTVLKLFNQQGIRVATASIGNDSAYYIPPYYRSKSGIIIDASCNGWTAVLNSSTMSFQNYSLIIITECFVTTTDILSNYPIQVDSDVTIAHKKDRSFELYEVYNTGYHYNGTFNIIKVGHWDPESSLCSTRSDRKNLQGLRIKVAAIILPSPKLENETVEQYMEKARTKVDTVHRMKFFILLKYMRDLYNIR